ncbi:TPA: type II secretion system protein GspL [Escherichia coli]|nr:type II secretion system protein GspL [Escherichia coli]
MKGLNKITCCLLAVLLMPCAGHAENEQYGANFNNADIRQFVEIVGQHLGKTILIDPSVQGTISVRSNDTFSQQEYYQFFLSILDLYGYSVITLDNGFLKVVRSANVKTSPGMIADSSRPGVGDELVTRIVPLENVPARDLAPLLRQMMDAGSVGNVVHYEPSNVLILTGRASTINKLIEVIKRVDVIGTEKQQIIHLEYASAEDLAEILNQLISESHGKSQMPALLSAKIVADKRTNSLIISGPEKARQRITSLLKSLDVEESEEGNTRVYYLKYAKATNLVEVLPDNTQDWHWTVVDKQNESVEVIGIQSEKLSRYLERLHTAGLNVTRVLPDGCYLPWEVDSWTLVNQQTSWLIRSAAHAFNELDEHWLQHLAAQFPPENMLCYGVVPHGVAAANPLIQHPEIPSLSLYSADIAFQRYDMLHGIFRKQKTVSKSGKWLARLAVSCLVLAILSFVGSRSIALWHTLKIEDQLQQQQQETWQRYFPQIKRTHNFRFYFKQQLAQQYPEAVPLLYHLQTLLLEHPELQLMEANYSQKQKSLTLKMSAKSEANIDRFCELTQSWLPMEKTEKDPVSGVWTVRNSGK